MKPLQLIVAGAVGIGLAAALYFGVLRERRFAPPAVGPGVSAVELTAHAPFWNDAHEMVPPIHLPQTGSGNGRIKVFVDLPDDARITAVSTAAGPSLLFPPGTIADRVEYRRKNESAPWQVADVRGTTLEGSAPGVEPPLSAEIFHLYRPGAPWTDKPLIGYAWRRGDSVGQSNVDALFADHLRHGRAALSRLKASRVDHVVDLFTDRAQCGTCHFKNSPEADVPPKRGVRRRADASGFYTPLSVLFNEGPPEFHRARDLNGQDPFIDLTCKKGGEPKLVTDAKGGRRYSCGKNDIAYASFRITEALAARDTHARRVCASRQYIYDHLDDKGRGMFAARFAECGIGPIKAGGSDVPRGDGSANTQEKAVTK